MREHVRRHLLTVTIHVVGWGFIILGIAAGFVPFVPGIVFGIIGIYLISLRSVWVKKKLDYFLTRYPKFGGIIRRLEKFLNIK